MTRDNQTINNTLNIIGTFNAISLLKKLKSLFIMIDVYSLFGLTIYVEILVKTNEPNPYDPSIIP
jgi:hypothetical protein